MLLGFLTIAITLALAYAYYREGLFTAFTMFCNVFLGGLIAFNFWEPLAALLEPILAGTFLRGYEDFFCLMILFCGTVGLFRTMTNALAHLQIAFPFAIQNGGAVIFGLATGYLTCGFLLCALQTLPWHQNFMFFDPDYETGPGYTIRRVMPPDRVWLALMYRAGAYAFANEEDDKPFNPTTLYDKYYTFDKFGTFELRYKRYRRYSDARGPLSYQRELDEAIRGPRR